MNSVTPRILELSEEFIHRRCRIYETLNIVKEQKLFETNSKQIAIPARKRSFTSFRIVSGANRDRTDNLLLARQVLSQLSYGPVGIATHLK